MSRDNHRQTQHKQRQQQAAVKDAVRAAAAVYTASAADASQSWAQEATSSSHVAQRAAEQANVQIDIDNVRGAQQQQQQPGSMHSFMGPPQDRSSASGSSSYRRPQQLQPMDSLWARRLKSTNTKLEESYRGDAAQAQQLRVMSPFTRPHSTPMQAFAGGRSALEAEPLIARPESTPTQAFSGGAHNSLRTQQAAMDFITGDSFAYIQGAADAANSRQRQVGGWTGEAGYNAQQQQQHQHQQPQQIDSDFVMAERSHPPVSVPADYDGMHSLDRDALLRLSPTQLVTSMGRPDYVDDTRASTFNSDSTSSSGWQMPHGMATPNWLGMSPQNSGSDYQDHLGDGFGSMSSFEHEPDSLGRSYNKAKRQSFSFDASTLARTDSGTGTQSSYDAVTPPNIFDEASPGASNSTDMMTTPSSSSVANSGASSAQLLEAPARNLKVDSGSSSSSSKATSANARPTRKAALRAQQRQHAASDGLTTSSSEASESVRSKPATKLPNPVMDSAGKFVCPHPGCNKKFSTNGHAKRHSHAHLAPNPFICPHEGCDATFSRRDNCTQHQRTRHGSVSKAYRQFAEDQAASPEQSADDSA